MASATSGKGLEWRVEITGEDSRSVLTFPSAASRICPSGLDRRCVVSTDVDRRQWSLIHPPLQSPLDSI